MSWTEVSPSLYIWKDTCNVYCIKKGTRGLLIDAGSGSVVEHLGEIGVDHVDWVLHSHHHRDQAWGTRRVREAGARVAVPEHERFLFENAELFWRTKRVYDNYNDRSTFFTVSEDIPVDAVLEDYETFNWEGMDFAILPAKGHTHGSSMFVTTIDGRRVAFTGDLMAAGGVLYQYHSLEYGYGDRIGALFVLQSLQALRVKEPELALPSHGEVIRDPVGDCRRLEDRLMMLTRLGAGTRVLGRASQEHYQALPDTPMVQLSRHLLWGGLHTCSNFYVILSKTGNACFVDYGHSFAAHMGTGSDREDFDTMRFVVHHLPELRDRYHVKNIDLVLITHIHDDHTVGIPYLQRHEGTEAWALDAVARVLKDPAAWCSTPCTLKKPITFARELSDGEMAQWEEYTFTFYHAPGQTEFHSVIAAEIDGQMVAFTGDNVFQEQAPRRSGTWQPEVYETTVLRNSHQLWMHRRCTEVMKRIAPEMVCPGHGPMIDWYPLISQRYTDFVARQEQAVRELVDEPADRYVDLFWARLRPYLREVSPGQSIGYTLMLRNNLGRKALFGARMLVPSGWEAATDRVDVSLSPDERAELTLEVVAPTEPRPRCILTAEILIDGESQGPIAEALITVTGD